MGEKGSQTRDVTRTGTKERFFLSYLKACSARGRSRSSIPFPSPSTTIQPGVVSLSLFTRLDVIPQDDRRSHAPTPVAIAKIHVRPASEEAADVSRSYVPPIAFRYVLTVTGLFAALETLDTSSSQTWIPIEELTHQSERP